MAGIWHSLSVYLKQTLRLIIVIIIIIHVTKLYFGEKLYFSTLLYSAGISIYYVRSV